jgi:serine phosphatase RsbU (regulator of sigma subunit)
MEIIITYFCNITILFNIISKMNKNFILMNAEQMLLTLCYLFYALETRYLYYILLYQL